MVLSGILLQVWMGKYVNIGLIHISNGINAVIAYFHFRRISHKIRNITFANNINGKANPRYAKNLVLAGDTYHADAAKNNANTAKQLIKKITNHK